MFKSDPSVYGFMTLEKSLHPSVPLFIYQRELMLVSVLNASLQGKCWIGTWRTHSLGGSEVKKHVQSHHCMERAGEAHIPVRGPGDARVLWPLSDI